MYRLYLKLMTAFLQHPLYKTAPTIYFLTTLVSFFLSQGLKWQKISTNWGKTNLTAVTGTQVPYLGISHHLLLSWEYILKFILISVPVRNVTNRKLDNLNKRTDDKNLKKAERFKSFTRKQEKLLSTIPIYKRNVW